MTKVQRWRYVSLATFFLVFFLVPVADIFRYDLDEGHFIFMGKPLTLGLDKAGDLGIEVDGARGMVKVFVDLNANGHRDVEGYLSKAKLAVTDRVGKVHKVLTNAEGEFSIPDDLQLPVERVVLLNTSDAQRILLFVLLPLLMFTLTSALIARRWGRLYCGWLCPHHSVVEIINGLMRKASGRSTIWARAAFPIEQSDGRGVQPNRLYWVPTAVAILLFSILWAFGAMSYVVSPSALYSDLLHFRLDGWRLVAVLVITGIVALDFAYARHLFCRYGCSVGILQSLFWMSNKRGLVVGFDRSRVEDCVSCDASCEIACPMDLPPRAIKRKMFSCTQCMRCIDACERVQLPKQKGSLLKVLDKECALHESERDFGRRPKVDTDCF